MNPGQFYRNYIDTVNRRLILPAQLKELKTKCVRELRLASEISEYDQVLPLKIQQFIPSFPEVIVTFIADFLLPGAAPNREESKIWQATNNGEFQIIFCDGTYSEGVVMEVTKELNGCGGFLVCSFGTKLYINWQFPHPVPRSLPLESAV